MSATAIDPSQILHTTLAPDAVASLLRSHWALEPLRLELYACRGRDTYAVETADAYYALTLARPADAQQLACEAVLTTRAAALTPPVSLAPLSAASGPLAAIEAAEGRRAAMLTPWATGTRLDQDRSIDACAALGRSLAQLQSIRIPEALRPLPAIDTDNLLQALRAVVDEPALEPLRSLGCLATPLGRQTCLHGDIDATNAFVDDTGELRLIDFELAAQGPRLYDVASFLAQLYAWPWPKRDAAAAAFIDAYLATVGVDADEWATIPELVSQRLLAVLARHLERAQWRGREHVTTRFAKHLLRDAHAVRADPPAWMCTARQGD